MSGRRLRSYRRGDWNEELGVLLLKALAAVAAIPRPEDFGLDAVATLLRSDARRRFFYTENSFYVQFKSESTNQLSYADHELKWLKDLQLPFFIGMVNRKTSSLNLFPGTELNPFLTRRHVKELIVRTSNAAEPKTRESKTPIVCLGKPLLSFTIEQASDEAYTGLAYTLLKDYLEIEQENVINRHIRCCRRIGWRTNEEVYADGETATLDEDLQKDELYAACEKIAPAIGIIDLYAEANGDRVLARRSSDLVGYLRKIVMKRESIGNNGAAWMQFGDPFAVQ
jgi:hypothetical protein